MTAPRGRATSVVSPRSGAQGGGVEIQSLETPAHEEVFSAANLDTPAKVAIALRRITERVRDDSRGARTLPVNGGTYFTGQTLTVNTVSTYAHGVGGVVAFIPCRVRATSNAAPVITEVGQTNDGRIQLATSANCITDLWFYPQPGLTSIGGATGTPASTNPPFTPTTGTASSVGVLSITAGAGIAISGTASVPEVDNTGVLSVTAGAGITNSGTAQNPILDNTGVLSVTAGTNITNSGTAQNPILNSTASGFTAGGDLAGSSTIQEVVTISGNGTMAEVLCPQVQFAQTLGPISIGVLTPVPNALPGSLQISAASANTSSSSNTSGASLTMSAGLNNSAGGQSSIEIVGPAAGAASLGDIRMRTSGVGGVPSDPSANHFPFRWTQAAVSVTSGVTTILSTAQSNAPWLAVGTVTLSGTGTTIAFPNVAGFWLLDLSNVTLGAFGITLTSGSSSSSLLTATNITGANQIVVVLTTGSNGIRTLA